jgi:GDP-mannose 6-dehydrogenase
MVFLAEHLLGKGYEITIVDPQLNPERLVGTNRRIALNALPHLEALMSTNVSDAVSSSEIVVAAIRCVPIDVLSKVITSEHIVIDVNGWPELAELDCQYEGLCWS